MSTSPQADTSPAPRPIFWIFAFGLLGLALFLFVNLWLRGTESASTDPEDAARDELRIQNLADLRTQDAEQLDTYAWTDRDKGSVQIPIERAMALVIADLQASQPRPAYPIDPAAAAMQAQPDPDGLPTEPVTEEIAIEAVEILTAPVEPSEPTEATP